MEDPKTDDHNAEWAQLKSIFEHARNLAGQKRETYLIEACRGREDLRTEIDGLLRDYSDATRFFQDLSDMIVPENGEQDELIGRLIGNYEVLEQLGEGGMGVVYKARHRTLNQFAALKFLSPRLPAGADARKGLIDEARAAYALDHPNICTIYDVDETEGGRLFISMAFYEGETLRERIRRGPVPCEASIEIATQICRGLSRAHAAQTIHGDIKPSNIFLTREGITKILDFGVAETLGTSSVIHSSKRGTIAYMSPEQIRGAAVDQRTDVWSLGVVLFEMLTGKHPFRQSDDGHREIAHAITDSSWKDRLEPGSPPDLPEPFLDRCLAKDPEQRYRTVGALLADITSARITRPAQAIPFPDAWSESSSVDSQRLYVPRASDRRILTALSEPGVTLTVKGPYQMGKSALLSRLSDQTLVGNKKTITVNFRSFDRVSLSASDTFFRQFSVAISDSVGAPDLVEKYWARPGSNPHRCSRYMLRHVIGPHEKEIVLCLDEVELLFDAPFRTDFFGMLRSWHNERATSPLWQKLSIVLSTSTEPYDLTETPNLSPFNVGETIELNDFTPSEVATLNEAYGRLLSEQQVHTLTTLVHGHPYLIKSALYSISTNRSTFAEIVDQAAERHGPFGDHLNYHLFRLGRRPDLLAGFRDVLAGRDCRDPAIVADLLGTGLVRRDSAGIIVRSPLYLSFFRRHLVD